MSNSTTITITPRTALVLLFVTLCCAVCLSPPPFLAIWRLLRPTPLGTCLGAQVIAVVLAGVGGVAALLAALIARKTRRNQSVSYLTMLAFVGYCVVLVLPTHVAANRAALRQQSRNQLRQIGFAIAQYAQDSEQRMPSTLEELVKWRYTTEEILVDPCSGKKFMYLGGGKKWETDDAVVACSPEDVGGRDILTDHLSVFAVTSDEFATMNRSRN